jgi:WD40 repeat protein
MQKTVPLVLLLLVSRIGFSQDDLTTVIQKGHELAVLSVSISSDSNYLVTGSKDKSIKLWEINSGREIRSFLGHDHFVNGVALSPDANWLLSGSYDKTVRLWNVSNGKQQFVHVGEDFITDVAFDPKMKFFVAAGYNRMGPQDSATIFDFKSKRIIKRLPVNADEGRGYGVSVSVSPDGKWIAFGEDNRTVTVYETSGWQRKYEGTSEGWCGGCATLSVFDGESKFLYTASHRGTLKKINLVDGTTAKTFDVKVEDLTGLSLSDDGGKIALAYEKLIRIFDSASGTLIAELPAEEKGEFHKTVFSRGGKTLIVTSDNNTAFLWEFSTGKKIKTFTGFLNQRDKGGLEYDPNFSWQSAIARYIRFKNSLLMSKDGKTLLKGKFGKKVKQWDIATGKTIMEFSGHEKAAISYKLSKDGKRLLTGGGDGEIILWDVATGDTLKVIRSYKEPVFDVSFNSDETKIVSSSWDATMKIHDLSTGVRTHYIEFPENSSAYNVIFHPNDLYLLSARLNHTIELWEPDTRTVVRNFVGHTDVISSITFSGDGKTVLSTSWDGSIRLWDVATGLMHKKFTAGKTPVYTAIFSTDEKTIYSAGADRTITVWDLSTGKILKKLEGHQAEITAVALNQDQKMLISHSVDGVTKFWDLNTNKEFFEHIHLGDNDWMVKNEDGYFNGTDDARKYIHFVSGMKTFSVDQFFNDFYRPDLLPKIFQNRGSAEMKNIQGKLKTSPPPGVKIALVSSGEGKAELLVRLTDNGAGAEDLKVFHNGKDIPLQIGSLKFPMSQGESTTYKQMVSLIGGQNIFSATARNRDRIESDPASAEIFSEHASKSSTCHILAVGINKYKNPKLTLNYAKPDAESFIKLVDQKSSLFKSVELHTLYDEEATRATILQKLDELASKINPEDVFIFYYAGHGSMVDNLFYFIPTESSRLYDAVALNREAIEASLLQDKFKHIGALKQLIIMDACQSGGSVELLATRGAAEEKAIAQLSRSAGIHVMASAGSEQFATEFTELGHGLFTYVLIRGLEGEADGSPKDGKVTIYELKSYIDDQVPEMTRKLKGKPQYPYTFSRGQDFPVAIE